MAGRFLSVRCRQVIAATLGCLMGALAHSSLGDDRVDFARDVRPILSNHCYACHGPDRDGQQNDLRLDVRAAALKTAIVPGNVAASPLIERATAADPEKRMPPASATQQPLHADQLEVLRRWIDQGAPYTKHWAYQIPQRAALPTTAPNEWERNEIDRFVRAETQAKHIEQAPDAEPVTLVRRLSFDLIGLPPSGEQVDEYLASPTEENYAKLVDHLLASEHFGERMAVMWLDLVRYADSCGYHGDQHRDLDTYRDYVIDAFNFNKPFDRFTIEQLAGDLLPDADLTTQIASGYNRLLQTTEEGGAQPKEYRAIYNADRVRNVSTVWLGSTIGCAQCHDHKYDPFTTRDFYRLAAMFADVEEVDVGRQVPNLELPTPAQAAALQEVRSELASLKADNAANGSQDGAEAVKLRLQSLEEQERLIQSQIRRTLVTRGGAPRITRVLPRGNWLDESGEVVEAAIPVAFQSDQSAGIKNRLDFARWLVSADNPLTSRVLVNQLWRIMFGYGLVRTPEDFGSQGQFPTHPELLDWLAVELQESGWNVKHLLRLMAMSRTYRQSSLLTDAARSDPYNLELARQHRFRLDAEFVRDNALAASGSLVDQTKGRRVRPYQPDGYWDQLNFPKRTYEADKGPSQYRRGIYTYWCRTFLHPSLAAFDAPTREECTAKRNRSNTPLQSLVLLNDPSYVEAALALAKLTLVQSRGGDEERLTWAFRRVLTRSPRAAELEVLQGVLSEQRRQFAENPRRVREVLAVGQFATDSDEANATEEAAWMATMRVLLNLHEAITRE